MVAQIIEFIIMQCPALGGSWVLSPNSATEAGEQALSFKSNCSYSLLIAIADSSVTLINIITMK
jgi:predicted alternative tryptophan synthase beta-subunit